MPRRFSALAMAMLALSVLAPATVIACGPAENCSNGPAPYTSAFPQRSSNSGRLHYYNDRSQPTDDSDDSSFDQVPTGAAGMQGYNDPRNSYGEGRRRGFGDGSSGASNGDRIARGYGGLFNPNGGMSAGRFDGPNDGGMPGRFRGASPDIYSRMGRASISPRLSGQSAEDYLAAMINDEGIGRWSPERFPLKVYFAPGRSVPGYRASFKTQMMDAFNEWVTVSNGKLAWKEVDTPQQADIYCQWTAEVNKQRPNEAGFTVAMAKNNDSSPIRTMGKAKVTILTHFNGRVLTDRDMRKVCLHELGHAYGLQGHSPYSDDIMFATTSPYQGEKLSQRDVRSIQNLYRTYAVPSMIGSLGETSSRESMARYAN